MRAADTLAALATLGAVGAIGYLLVPALSGTGEARSQGDPAEAAGAVSLAQEASPPVPQSNGSGLPEPAEGWIEQASVRTGVPPQAVRSYARAALAVPRECGLGWTTVAGIGWVESHHGTIGGRVLGVDGRSDSLVVGPALDGEGDVAAIRATAAGTALHGDATWERAVGPMQFLPSTWEQWRADGDGDGDEDPGDLDDASLAAARYLCHAGGDLRTVSGWSAAVRAYNHSDAYVRAVNATANAYAQPAG